MGDKIDYSGEGDPDYFRRKDLVDEMIVKRRRKIIFFFSILIVALIIFSSYMLFIKDNYSFNLIPEKEKPVEQVTPEVEEIVQRPFNWDGSACDFLERKKDQIYCRIDANVKLGNESYCSWLQNQNNLSFPYGLTYKDITLVMNSSDYCWMTYSKNNKTNYCSNLENYAFLEDCNQEFRTFPIAELHQSPERYDIRWSTFYLLAGFMTVVVIYFYVRTKLNKLG